MWQTTVRESITPYVPPPLVRAFQTTDRQLESLGLGPEGSITVLSTVCMAWMVYYVVIRVLKSTYYSGKAIVDDDEDDHDNATTTSTQSKFDSTIVLCGPPQAGKTCLFYQLCYFPKKSYMQIPTVTSIKPNIGVCETTAIRYMDWPGHKTTKLKAKSFLEDDVANASLAKLWNEYHHNSNKLRFVLVLDATQPVKDAAAVLYQIWSSVATAATASSKKNNNSNTSHQLKWPLLVCCHKQDIPKCKNSRRIRIQLRTELEKLVSVKQPPWLELTPAGGLGLAEDNTLPYLQFIFLETSSEKPSSLLALRNYCETGALPTESQEK